MESVPYLFHKDGQVHVACPYCYEVHTHGDQGSPDVSGNWYSAHCHKGEYRLTGVFDFRAAQAAFRLRDRDIRRKRAARAKERQMKTTIAQGES